MSFDAPEPWRPPVSGSPAPAPDAQPAVPERPRLRPPIGIPTPPARRLPSTLLAIALHVLVLFIILAPIAGPAVLREITGAGGEEPAGGGGGGTRGTGGDNGGWGVRERLHFVQTLPPAAPTPPVVTPPVPPPVPPPPTPEVPPPKPAVTPPATPAPAATTTPAETPTSAAAGADAPTPGSGGGTGADGSSGSGPGSGGGVGAGVGTGRGSGTGPGTGGGTASVLPPQMIEMFIPPLPVPRKVVGSTLLAVFDVDSTGRLLKVDFTPTPDGGYNKKLRDVLSGFRFRPGTRSDGTPVRAQVSVTYSL